MDTVRSDAVDEIREMVDRETRAWDARDVELLVSIFHPDMVWPWPRTPSSHDPVDWVLKLGRYDRERWRRAWQELFDTHTLVHNRRTIRKIEVSKEGDAAFAVVDVDTLWRDEKGNDFHWKGRACKAFTRVGADWKLIMHTGLLDYGCLKPLNPLTPYPGQRSSCVPDGPEVTESTGGGS